MARVWWRLASGAAVTAAVVLTGCAGQPPSDGRAPITTTPITTGADAAHPVRTDLPPLLARFPALGGARSASWVGWASAGGRSSVPGPSTYWIHAVVDVGTDRVAALADTHHAMPVAGPRIAAALAAAMPAGDLLGGTGLDAAFTSGQWHTSAFLSPGTGEVVLISRDD